MPPGNAAKVVLLLFTLVLLLLLLVLLALLLALLLLGSRKFCVATKTKVDAEFQLSDFAQEEGLGASGCCVIGDERRGMLECNFAFDGRARVGDFAGEGEGNRRLRARKETGDGATDSTSYFVQNRWVEEVVSGPERRLLDLRVVVRQESAKNNYY